MPNPSQHGALQLELSLWQLRFPFAVVPEVSRNKAPTALSSTLERDQVVLQEICNPLKFRSETESVVSRREQCFPATLVGCGCAACEDWGCYGSPDCERGK